MLARRRVGGAHNDRMTSTSGPKIIVSMTHIVRLCTTVALDANALNTTALNATALNATDLTVTALTTNVLTVTALTVTSLDVTALGTTALTVTGIMTTEIRYLLWGTRHTYIRYLPKGW